MNAHGLFLLLLIMAFTAANSWSRAEPPDGQSKQGTSQSASTAASKPADAACCKGKDGCCCKDVKACCCKTTDKSAGPCCSKPIADLLPIDFIPYTKWVEPSERKKVAALDAEYTDQDGNTGTVADLIDRPSAITFFYTRCENPHKCSAAVTAMATLQEALKEAGLDGKVRLVMISYEPQYDTPGRLKNYASGRRVQFDDQARMLRLESKALVELTDSLKVPVNYNAGWVNIHGIGLFLLDKEGRLARTYHTVIWKNDSVVKDLKSLVDEPPCDTPTTHAKSK